ncbi:MAG: ATP-binding protein [Desulfobacterales bacterium]
MTTKRKYEELERLLKSVEDDLLWEVEVNASISELTNKLIMPNDIECTSSTILNQIKYLTESRNGFAGYFEPQSGHFICASVIGNDEVDLSVDAPLPIFSEFGGKIGKILKSKKSLMANKSTKKELLTAIFGNTPIHGYMFAPALVEDKLVGQICIANPDREYDERDLMLIKRLAVFYAIAIQRSWMDETIRAANDNLERKIEERTQALADSNERLKNEISIRKVVEEKLREAKINAEIANRSKSAFLANMSHEVRTPLNHIIGFTELVCNKHYGPLNETQEEFLNDVIDSSHHLLSLINDILDLSKIEAGKLELELSSVPIKTLLENSLTMIKEKALKHSVELSINTDGIPETITADERKLKQIIYNLLSNAIKFTPDNGQISLTAHNWQAHDTNHPHVFDPESRFICISVSDTGIGLNSEDLERIFDSFEQVESSHYRRFQGTGLGLSLTKQLVELHGGKIWAESEGSGRGSTFHFIIQA